MARIPTRTVNLARQASALRTRYRNANVRLSRGVLHCRLDLQPTPASRTYTADLYCRPPWRPRVTIVEPRLRLRPDADSLPHVYPGDELCLYYGNEWNPSELIAATIVPWTSEWLEYYELWHATGSWLGGGIEHGI